MTMAARPPRPSLALGLLLLVLSMTLLAITSNAEPEIAADPWAPVDAVLKEGIESMAYPGCVALVGTTSGIVYWRAFGNYTYGVPPPFNNGNNPPMERNTLFDMASTTKIISTTSAVAQFYQRGELSLDTRVASVIGEQFSANGKGPITIAHLLLHRGGLRPDPNPNYYEPTFSCPETSKPCPAENFSCQTKIYNDVMNQTLQYPIDSAYIYSDLGYITLMYVVGHLARIRNYVSPDDLVPGCDTGGPGTDQCYFEAYVRKYVFSVYHMPETQYLLPNWKWGLAAPCHNDTGYTHKVLQGQTSDANTYAMGGIAGHAGIFSTASDLAQLASRMLFPDAFAPFQRMLNETTIALFTTEYNHTQSSRALGWDTNDPDVSDYGFSQACGGWSKQTFLHVGFTGTQICCDPVAKVFTIFLTNRLYPFLYNNQMLKYRRAFNNAVIGVLNSNASLKTQAMLPYRAMQQRR